MDWEFSEYPLGFAVAPDDPDRVILTDLGFVHVSADGGATFQQAYVAPRDQNPAGADTPPSRAYRTSGVEQTSYWYLTWADERTLFASVTDIRTARSIDAGHSWSRDGRNGATLNTTYHVIQHPRTGALYGAASSVHDPLPGLDLARQPDRWHRDAPGVRSDHRVWRPGRELDGGARYGSSGRVAGDRSRPRQPAVRERGVHSVDGGIYRLDLASHAPPVKLPAPPRTKGHAFNIHVLDDGSLVATYAGHRTAIPAVPGALGRVRSAARSERMAGSL